MAWTSPLGNPRTTPLTSGPPDDTLWSPMTRECTVFDVASYTVIGGPICCFGIIGNFLSYLVLNRTKDPKYYKDNKTIVTSFLLSALAVADALLSMAAIPLYVLQPLSFYQAAHNSSVRYLWPMYQMPYTGAVLLTVLVSFNRYMAACRPFSGTGSDLAASRKHVTAVVVFSVLYNIPRFFEYQKETHFNAKLNVTEEMFSLSPLGSNTLYRVIYCNVLYFLLVHGGPLICLSFLNYKLLTALKERHRRKEKLRGGSLVATRATQAAVPPGADKNKNGFGKVCHLLDDEKAENVAIKLLFDSTLKKSLPNAPFPSIKNLHVDSGISKQCQRSCINRFSLPIPTSQHKPSLSILSLSKTYFGRLFLTKSLPDCLENDHPLDIRHSWKTDLSTDHRYHHPQSEPSVARLRSVEFPNPGWMTSCTNLQICGVERNETNKVAMPEVVEKHRSENVFNFEVDVRLDGLPINRIDQISCAKRQDPAIATARDADAIMPVTATVKAAGRDQQKQKQDLTFVLIVVVFTFIFCHTPAFVDTILWTILDGSQKSCGRWLFYYTAIADILVMFNSSANFAIYVLTSPRFRSDLISYLSLIRFRHKNNAP